MLQIRATKPEDVKILLTLFRELAEFEKLAHEMKVDEKRLKDSLFSDKPAAYALIAEVDNKPVGYAVYFFNYSTFLGKAGLYLEDLYVRPSARGQGIALALLERIAGVALEHRCERMDWVVLDWNV